MAQKTLKTIFALSTATVLAACGGGGGGGDGGGVASGPTPAPAPAPAPAPSPAPAPAPTPATYSVKYVGATDNFTAFAFLPDGRALFGRQDGTLLIGDIEGTPSVLGRLPVFVISGAGITGIAVDPRFATTGRIFVSVTEGPGPTLDDVGVAVVRVTLAGASISDQTTIWRSPRVSTTPVLARFGGSIAVDPTDGDVLLATGDIGDPSAAQNPASFKGKVLRMTQSGARSTKNPTAAAGALDLVYAYGLRQPRGMHITSDGTVYAVDDAPNKGDELNIIRANANYGWPLVSEGSTEAFVDYPKHATRPDIIAPIYATPFNYSFQGVTRVVGSQLDLRGEILVGTFGNGIIRLVPEGNGVREAGDRISPGGDFVGGIAERPTGGVYGIRTASNSSPYAVVKN